jgi:hypothetical protein
MNFSVPGSNPIIKTRKKETVLTGVPLGSIKIVC